MHLDNEWNKLRDKLTYSEDNFFEKVLKSKYSENGRYYHNMWHVNSILRLLKEFVGKEISTPLLLAAWFHDLEYDARSVTNELESSEIMYDYLSSIGMHNDFICEVDDLIYATKHHEVREDATASIEDQQLFVDLDMAIIGTRKEKYDKYAMNIMKELTAVYSEDISKELRISFLEETIDRENLFKTPAVKERYETRAYENMKRELSELLK